MAEKELNAGLNTREAYLQATMELLALKRERATAENTPEKIPAIIGQQIALLRALEKRTTEWERQGRLPVGESLKVRRLTLLLERQKAELA